MLRNIGSVNEIFVTVFQSEGAVFTVLSFPKLCVRLCHFVDSLLKILFPVFGSLLVTMYQQKLKGSHVRSLFIQASVEFDAFFELGEHHIIG